MSLTDPQWWEKLQQEHRAEAQAELDKLWSRLNAMQYQGTITVTYNGEGDEGAVDEISAEEWEPEGDDRELIETATYAVLETVEPGWENGDGAFGEIKFNAKEQKVYVYHNTRETISHEFNVVI